MTDLLGKTALITGAAEGIGAAIARAMASAGARLVLADVNEDGLKALQQEIGADNADISKTDVSQDHEMAKAVAIATERCGGLDIAVLNAGIEGAVAPITEFPIQTFDKVIGVNLRGVFLGLRHTAKAMSAGSGGSIIIMSSVAGIQGTAGFSAYTASKHGVIGLMKCAALELAPMNIRVNTVNPGPIETRMMRSIEEGFSPGHGDAVHQLLNAGIPLQRYGTSEEVARLTLFLASDAASYCTGGVYTVDGGMTAGRAIQS